MLRKFLILLCPINTSRKDCEYIELIRGFLLLDDNISNKISRLLIGSFKMTAHHKGAYDELECEMFPYLAYEAK